MVMKICDRCQTRYIVNDKNIVDFVHDCSQAESEALRNEDVFDLGSFIDFVGTGNETGGNGRSAKEILMQGVENKFFGQRAAIEGEDFEGVTSRGKRSATHRTRKHFAYKSFR